MVDWNAIFMKMMHSLIGLYAWEFIISLDFDWAVLTGKKRFRWPLVRIFMRCFADVKYMKCVHQIFYFAGRYLLLAALVGIAVAMDVSEYVIATGSSILAFPRLSGNAAVGLASINLSLRTIAIWSQSKWIIALLILLILGHWSLILQGVLLGATWAPGGCQITYSNTTILSATFIYSMCFDFVVMCLSAYKLAWVPARNGTNGTHTRLIMMLFSDGLIYFFIAFMSNLVATTFMVLNLNPTMSIIFNVPAAIASTIVASRVVRRLTNFQISGPEIIGPKKTSIIAFNGANPRGSGSNHTGIHVEMDTFTHPSSAERYAPYRPRSSLASYDVDRKRVEPVIPGALAENVPECPALNQTEQAGHHYIRRWQIWSPVKPNNPAGWPPVAPDWAAPPVQFAWQPYDPSSVESTAPREDVENYFYLDVRYHDRDEEPDLVFNHFSNTLIDFLRMAVGGEFFNPNPESPLTHLVFKLDDIKAHRLDARSALCNLSGKELRAKAQELGRLDSLSSQKTEQDARQYLEDLADHLDVLVPLVEKEFKPISDRLELELSYGHLSFDLLSYYFKKGEKYYYNYLGNKMTLVLDRTRKSSSFGSFSLVGHGIMWDGYGYANESREVIIPHYPGTKALSDLVCKIISDDVHNELTERGRLYSAVSGVHFKSCNGRRVIIDRKGYDGKEPIVPPDQYIPASPGRHYTSPPPPPPPPPARRYHDEASSRPGSPYPDDDSWGAWPESIEITEDQLDLLPVNVYGFDSWEMFDVRNLEEIHFDEDAWDHLVLNKATKALIKGLVNVTKTSNTSREVFSDVITGKGGGLIALLHGPPGTGKTLTAEAVAEHLKRPLYVLSSLELSTTPATLEKKLGDILRLATTWDAVVLIDEADVFLEQRSLHELERNALVSVALRVLEYHRGVLFLTTNRIQAFDEAFLSRFSIAVKYPELDADARLTIWRNFFELAGCELWGGSGRPGDGRHSPDEFVRLEGQEPQCYVSLSDLKELAKKPFNGRTIKNLVRTAQALAMSLEEPLSSEHVKVVVEAQEKFLTEFAQIKL
ncbi:hypothetical protein AZE42_03217 [Rhizopogon vesiculosus]|uniref:AAA+ ATPase domain-containing protein n=1 Tax=Rhizopogon vesiculosus TaxID=180088 RepID=A0A1J8Q1L9_9AGAM|nr:hypothetical protein AZE42_03217 [Rhizopogon vesiculosus]